MNLSYSNEQRIEDLQAKGRWVGMSRQGNQDETPAVYLKKSFTAKSAVKRATLTWTVLGLGKFTLNGDEVGNDFLVPGWSDFRKRTQVLSYDLTKHLQTGENELVACLGDGWYCGHLLFKRERDFYGNTPQLLAMIDIEYQNSESECIYTDESWLVGQGKIRMSDIYDGETFDSNFSFQNWQPADIFPAYDGELEYKINDTVQVTETLQPVDVTWHESGVYIFDFGQNFAGLCRLRLQGKKNQKIVLRFAEMLQDDGSLYLENLRLAKATDTYICAGEGVEEWTPSFTYHGFRYVSVDGLTQEPPADLLTGLVLHTQMKPLGTFECSNADINQLHSNIRWGLRSNFVEIPTDCPQRDERLGWTGDAQIFVGTAAFHYDVKDFFRKWMKDLVDGQLPNGAFPDIAPDVLHGLENFHYTFGNAAWADAGVICPWMVYWHTGDVLILEENYSAMRRWMEYQIEHSRDLVREPTVYGDWLAIDAVRADRAPVPTDFVGTAYFAYTAFLMGKIATVLGREEDVVFFRELHERIRVAFQKEFVTNNGRLAGECQTAYLLALAFDLLPEELEQKALTRLVYLIESRDYHLTTGFIGTPLLCPVLTKYGRTDVAYKLLFQDTYPSWLYPIRNGATTMWERWNSYTKECGFGPVEMNSFNHYAYGAIGEWMYQVVGGIRATEAGYKKVEIAPQPHADIDWAKISLKTPHGLLRCEWKVEGDFFTIDTEIPPGVQAVLLLPIVCESVDEFIHLPTGITKKWFSLQQSLV